MKKVKNTTKKRILAMTLSLLPILCLSGCGRKEASLGTESTAITETSDAAAETTENDPSDGEDFVVDLPEDNGGLAVSINGSRWRK